MTFNDTTNKNGIIQTCEFWTNLGDGGISNDATLLKVFTARVNEAFDRLIPFLLSFSTYLKWDDPNNSDNPVGKFNLVSDQSDYSITQDDNSLDILNIARLSILTSSDGTDYYELEEMTQDDDRAILAMSPNTTDVGIPTHFLKRQNKIFLYPQPNYAATNGVKIYFERQESYFASNDTTKEPGIPTPFHGLLPLYASYDWLLVNKPDNGAVITRLEAQITRRERELRAAIEGQYPTKTRIRVRECRDFE